MHAVFPDSIVYLCAFHRLQAWLWWIVNTKNGISNYQTYCMGFLRAVGDAKMEDAYMKALMDLQSPTYSLRYQTSQLLHAAVGTKEEGNQMKCGLVMYCYNSCGQEQLLFFCYFADVGSGIPCQTPTV